MLARWERSPRGARLGSETGAIKWRGGYILLPDDVTRLILTSIPTVPHLEALLLIRGEPQTVWDATLASHRLYIPERIAEQVLADLAASGFIVATPGHPVTYRYQTESSQHLGVVDRLAAAHAHDLLEVTNLIHGGKSGRLFADAFKFRKE